MAGYHKRKIVKGEFGKFSKIREEFEEMLDAHEQGNFVMELCEMADLLGAMEKYLEKRDISLQDLVTMKEATKRAFKTGHRK